MQHHIAYNIWPMEEPRAAILAISQNTLRRYNADIIIELTQDMWCVWMEEGADSVFDVFDTENDRQDRRDFGAVVAALLQPVEGLKCPRDIM